MEEIDLFSQWETLPKEVIAVMDKYGNTQDYDDCRIFIAELFLNALLNSKKHNETTN